MMDDYGIIFSQVEILTQGRENKMDALLLRLLMQFLTDENIRKLVEPIKKDLILAFEKYAQSTPGQVDDVLLKVVKVVFGA